jgi:hypothetical protein
MIAALIRRRFIALCLLVPASLLRATPAAALGFAAPITAGVGNEPRVVAIADLNEDGRPDLLVTSRYENTISVLLANPDGTWGPRTLIDNGSYWSYLAVGDVDRDGHLDVVAGSSNDYVSVFLGDGHGNLTLASTPPTGLYPVSIGIGDLNGDGWPDLVTSNPGTLVCCHSVTTVAGTGSGSFAAPTKLAATRDMTDLALGDFDEDGALDILAGQENGGGGLYFGNGDGTFRPPVGFSVINLMYDVDVADMNRDGHLDVVVAGWPASALVVLGNGDGTFRPPVAAVAGGENSYSVAEADFDGDGNPDVATCEGDSVAIALGMGDGAFGQTVFVPCGSLVYAVAPPTGCDSKPSDRALWRHGRSSSTMVPWRSRPLRDRHWGSRACAPIPRRLTFMPLSLWQATLPRRSSCSISPAGVSVYRRSARWGPVRT